MKSLKTIICFFILICLVISFHSCKWGAGSYPYSEVYMIDLSSSNELIDKINEMKLRSPQLNVHYKNENEDTVTLDVYTVGTVPIVYGMMSIINNVQDIVRMRRKNAFIPNYSL